MANELAFYSPDTDPTVAGTLTNVVSLIPSLKGYKSAPSPILSNLPALGSQCYGAATLKRLDGVSRYFAGTATGMFEASTSTWTDVTRTASAYSLASDSRWTFAQYGNTSIAANKSTKIQFSNSGAFADITNAPAAALVEVVNNFLFAANTNEVTYGDSPDRVWWSALGDYTIWTPSSTTQAGTTRAQSRAGKVTALKRFGSSIIIYKADSMYIGSYVGVPLIWDVQDIQGEIGTPCQNTVLSIGTPDYPRHIFMGMNDFFQFGGGTPTPIGTSIKISVFSEMNYAAIENSYAIHDKINSLVYFYYPSGGSTLPDKCVVYNYKVDKWGRDDRNIECASSYASASMTYGDLGTYYATYGDLPNISYAGSIFSTSYDYPSIFATDHALYKLTGTSLSSSFTTGDYGDEVSYKLLSRIKPQFIQMPTSASMDNYYRDSLGASLNYDQTVNINNSRFDVLRSSRWHRVRVNMIGNAELNSFSVIFRGNGNE